ncbi:MAG: endonuclease/exonuclease/phosphatase family protein [Pseudomonadota bacterium]
MMRIWRGFFRPFLAFGAACLCLGLVLGWFQSAHPALDSFSHFRMVFAALLAFTLPVLWLTRLRKLLWTSVAVLLVSVALSAPYLPGFERGFAVASLTGDKPKLRVVQMNLRFDNRTPLDAADIITDAKADIIILQEVTRYTDGVLARLQSTHPTQITCHTNRVGSVAILSRYPLDPVLAPDCRRWQGFAQATLRLPDQFGDSKSVTVASFHSHWPWPRGQAAQLARLESTIQRLPGPLIFAGDFNSAPWSAVVQRLAKWTNTQVVSGLHLTWAPRTLRKTPEWLRPFTFALLPIDHILHSRHFAPADRERLGHGGSDHYAVVTDFVFVGK